MTAARRLRFRPLVADLAWGILVLGVVGMVLAPLLWMVTVSLRPFAEVFSFPPSLLPKHPTLEGYASILADPDFIRSFASSVAVSLIAAVLAVAVGALGAYALSRYRFAGRGIAHGTLLATQLVPTSLLVIPLFLLAHETRTYDTYAALIIPYVTLNLPFCILMLTRYFDGVPRDLEEAAMVDGCSELQAIRLVTVRLSLPGIVATCVFSFLLSWQELMLALSLTRSQEMRLLPVQMAALFGQHGVHWNEVMAVSVLASIPVVLAFLVIQRYLMEGLAFGVKG